MMSLVGCSGEEFADILRTLGYRLERRRAELPAPDTAAAAVAPDAAAALDAPGEVRDLEVWRPKPRNRPSGARSPDQRRSRPAGDSAEPQRRVRKRKNAKDAKDAKESKDAKGEHRAGRKQAPDRKPDRGPSPTSPFAALGALKKVLEQNQIAKNRERS
jgi:ATP-dependent RNA helicase SUPV3L1/SUV3